MHIILILLMICSSTDVIDAYVLRNILSKSYNEQQKIDRYCNLNGGISLTTEMIAYFYLFSYSFIMKKNITSITSNITNIVLKLHVTSLSLPLIIYIACFFLDEGFGPSVSFVFFNLKFNIVIFNMRNQVFHGQDILSRADPMHILAYDSILDLLYLLHETQGTKTHPLKRM